mgnify:CR=1 FL=1
MRSGLGLVLGVVAGGLLGGVASHAVAQERVVVATSTTAVGPGSTGRMTRELVERMANVLTRDEIQREVAMDLFRELSSTKQELGDALRAGIESARIEGNDGDIAEMVGKIRGQSEAYNSRVRELEGTFMEDVRAMLTEEQEQDWAGAERLYRRGIRLPSLLRAQARVDVDALVRDEFEEAVADENITEALERWSIQLDSMLLERQRKVDAMDDGNDGVFQELVIGGTEDPYKDLREIDARIVTLGEQTVRSIAGVLEDDAIEQAWLRKAFTRVYRETQGEKRLAAALELEDLSDELREQLDTLSTQHEREGGPARQRWARAESEREEESVLPPGVSVMISGGSESPSAKARDAVNELSDKLERRLASILSAEQLAELPKGAGENVEGLFRAREAQSEMIRIGG